MPINISDNIYLHCFAKIEKLGPASLKRIFDYFPSAKEAFESPIGAFHKLGLNDLQLEAIIQMQKSTDPEKELELLESSGIGLINSAQPDYPPLLRQITLPPTLLYYRGDRRLLAGDNNLAVVGTRKISPYGRTACQSILPGLISSNLAIVSGLALGIDALAHELTLYNRGTTIAVLGSSVSQTEIYPAHNRRLGQQIVEDGGLLVSEYAPGSSSIAFHFPVRNRIISGLSLGTLVIEADEKSGSLITAQSALDQNREVFAVPGPIYSPTSRGANQLIQRGAKLVMNAEDILSELEFNQSSKTGPIQEVLVFAPVEEMILKILNAKESSIDDLVEATKYPVSVITSALLTLELKGAIRQIGHGYIRI